MPKFTIVMPLYNKAPYVGRAVQSVLSQSLEDWQLWVVDDGSTDGSLSAIASVADPRVHTLRQSNMGVSVARNRGVSASAEWQREAEGASPWLCFLDADDWWESRYLESMAALVERYPDAGIYGTGYYIVKNGRQRVAPIGVDQGFAEGKIDYCAVYARTLCQPLWTGAVCMPRAVFDAAGGFAKGITLGEDFMLWLPVACQQGAVLLNQPLSNYCQDANPAYRGTAALVPPEQNYMWQATAWPQGAAAQLLRNRLLAYGLQRYWLSKKYHSAAAQLLAGLDLHEVSPSIRRTYTMPLPYMRAEYAAKRLLYNTKQHLCHR